MEKLNTDKFNNFNCNWFYFQVLAIASLIALSVALPATETGKETSKQDAVDLEGAESAAPQFGGLYGGIGLGLPIGIGISSGSLLGGGYGGGYGGKNSFHWILKYFAEKYMLLRLKCISWGMFIQNKKSFGIYIRKFYLLNLTRSCKMLVYYFEQISCCEAAVWLDI